jgi:hypothetical protein
MLAYFLSPRTWFCIISAQARSGMVCLPLATRPATERRYDISFSLAARGLLLTFHSFFWFISLWLQHSSLQRSITSRPDGSPPTIPEKITLYSYILAVDGATGPYRLQFRGFTSFSSLSQVFNSCLPAFYHPSSPSTNL